MTKTQATSADTSGQAASLPTDTQDMKTITLDYPITRGTQIIETITVRKPKAGALRGVTLVALTQIDVTALQTVLPRIADPMLTEKEIANMDPADLMTLGATVSGFFFTRADRAAYQIS